LQKETAEYDADRALLYLLHASNKLGGTRNIDWRWGGRNKVEEGLEHGHWAVVEIPMEASIYSALVSLLLAGCPVGAMGGHRSLHCPGHMGLEQDNVLSYIL
jgi:hypothetical protein